MSLAKATQAWTLKAKRLTDETLQEAIRLLVGELVRAMPYDTGNLSRSVEVSLDGMRPMDRDPNAQYVDPSATNAATILQARVGQPVFISVTAPYAARINYGYTKDGVNQGGEFFIAVAASKWAAVMDQAARNVRGRA